MNLNPLIAEEGRDVSLGRISFWILLGISIYFWIFREIKDYPITLNSYMLYIIVYNFGKKLVGPVSEAIASKK